MGNKMGIKVLRNNKKSNRLNGTSKGRIGLPLKIKDCNGEVLAVGDFVKYGDFGGVLLYNHHLDQYGVAVDTSLTYGHDEYSIDSYAKFVPIPMDNGARMEIIKQ